MRRIFTTTVRLNLEEAEDRMAWEHLQQLDKKRHKSYSNVIVLAINEYFDRQERLGKDSYLETREKEEAFLLRIEESVRRGMQAGVQHSGGAVFSPLMQHESTPMQPSVDPAIEDDDANAALDFVDSF